MADSCSAAQNNQSSRTVLTDLVGSVRLNLVMCKYVSVAMQSQPTPTQRNDYTGYVGEAAYLLNLRARLKHCNMQMQSMRLRCICHGRMCNKDTVHATLGMQPHTVAKTKS